MKVDIIGGGPAGLYFAILHKKANPSSRVTVFEQNRADDTFGFGIVLSDQTLSNLKAADEPTYREIGANFAYWDDIYTWYKGTVLKSSGHGFSGLNRLTMLQILQRRAAELGVEVKYQTRDAGIETHRDADLVLAADGVNSAVREAWKQHFEPTIEMRPNKFTWLGAEANLPGFTYSFRENAAGIWTIHSYMYTKGQCTVVFETTDEAFAKQGLAITDEKATAALAQSLFNEELGGGRILTNKSHWRNFPNIKCRRWSHENVVLVGDAAHTAHFSIGSGTKLALEDVIALHGAVERSKHDIPKALKVYEEERRPETERIQHSANTSLVWFENVRRFWHMDPIQFNFSMMSRSKQITFENLRVRDATAVAEIEDWWNRKVADESQVKLPSGFKAPPMFAPFKLRDMTLVNRVVVSPMAQYSAVEGAPTDWHLVHYGARALGGAGLVYTEMACPSADARITLGCAGMYAPEHVAGWKRVVDFAHANSQAKLCMQLGHAGRKGSTQLGWETMDKPLPAGNWPLVSASPLPYLKDESQVPREMTRADMDRIRDDFVRATRMTDEAGFDMLELHMAHGYLFAAFISPITNRRTDEYGGSLANRLRWPLEVFDACRAAWPQAKPMAVRISATDWIPGGTTGLDAVEIARTFKAHGCDLIDVSTGQTDPASAPVYGRMYQATFAEQVRLDAGIATMAVGNITTADQVNTLIASGRADLVALARPHLTDPNFTLHAAAEYDFRGVSWPKQYLSGRNQLYLLTQRAKEEAARKEAEARPEKPDLTLLQGGRQVA
jgi:anthraniloyl-CoA monooxygenase